MILSMTASHLTIAERVNLLDWTRVERDLDDQGSAVLGTLLSSEECQALAALYSNDAVFRSRVVMSRHGFGRGEYKYFSYPLPDPVAVLRTALYPKLAPIANRWNAEMRSDVRYPERHTDFLERCHQAGQSKPTPLLLQYGPDDYNCLHQDLYGEHVFPLQVAFLLSKPGEDFQRWRIRHDGAAAAHAVASCRCPASPGRWRRVCGSSPPGTRGARHLSSQSAPWRKPCAIGPSPHHWRDFPRCSVSVYGELWIGSNF